MSWDSMELAKIAGATLAGLFGGLKLRKSAPREPKTQGNGHDFKSEWIASVDERLGSLDELSGKVQTMSVEFGYVKLGQARIEEKLDTLQSDITDLRIALGVTRTN